ncbi:glycosyltransferase [Massilia sp. DWR3-1-1]|uniref:glycosyltransferase n=1 Tax=Massilia sp. DWR3-1-1 TaxID=2804559 RepID=UPI003CED036C
MKHLFICREYPPAAYLPGGIGTYVRNIAESLASAGETVVVIAHRWAGAPRLAEQSFDGRLTVHRIALDEPVTDPAALSPLRGDAVQRGMLASSFPAQAFGWQAALLAERLIDSEGIDVVEAQEWEAPLYYLQRRRALGLGPQRQPACVVHLHSSSESIFNANAWDTTVADYAPAAAMEAWSIRAADAILAPSRFIADEAIARYGIARERVTVIAYPLGRRAAIASQHDWSGSTVCHIGRLELRKGVLEWAQAVDHAAHDYPALRAEFAGGDTPVAVTGVDSVRAAMLRPIGAARRGRLHFHGNLGRSGMDAVMARSFAAAIPSRWENFPNTCMEAMLSGLPVIVSPNGGMRELVEDGVTGWIAADGSAAGLAAALARALATTPAQRAVMGAAAHAAVLRRCDTADVVRQHLLFKGQLVQAHTTAAPAAGRIAVLVSGHASTSENSAMLEAMFASLRSQTLRPAAIGLVGMAAGAARCAAAIAPTIEVATDCAMNAAVEMAADGTFSALLMVDVTQPLSCGALAALADMFARDAALGAASGWLLATQPAACVLMAESVAVPQRWHGVAGPLALRADALREQAGTAAADVVARILEGRWHGAVYPGILALTEHGAARPAGERHYSAMALAVRRLHMPPGRWLMECPPPYRHALLNRALAQLPARLVARLAAPLVAPERTIAAIPYNPDAALAPVPAPSEQGAPLVSVIIAAYNGADYIGATLRSVFAQTLSDIEVIVVDDGSTDHTAALVSAMAVHEPRLRLIRQSNQGVAAARNRAIGDARGTYVAPVDADDLWAPTKLARQVARIEQCGPETGLVYCWWAWIDQHGALLDRSPRWREEGNVLARLLQINFTGNASIPLYRLAFVRRHGGYSVRLRDLGCQGCEDWDLVLRIAEHSAVACVPEILVGYRRYATSMSAGCAVMWRSGTRVIDELAARQPALGAAAVRHARAQLAMHLAGVAFWSKRYLAACGWALRVPSAWLSLAIAMPVLRMLLRRLVQPGRPGPTTGHDWQAADGIAEPLIPYDAIYARHWAATSPIAAQRLRRERP